MSISDQQDGRQCEVGTGVGHRVHHLPAWGDPYLLEGGDRDGGEDHDVLVMVVKIMMIIYVGMSLTILVSLGKLIIDEMAGERRGVDLCQSEGNT